MNEPKITIGMATYDDFEGVWATVQSVFLHNDWASPDDVQIVIVDTSPVESEHRRLVKDLVAKGGHAMQGARTPNIKYVDMASHPGTTEPRNAVFDNADADVVVCMDCHVMLRSNSLLQLLNWFEANPECKDLVHGPIMYDNLHMINTQFSDQFRGGMWGTWSTAWRAPDGTMFVCEGEEVTDENRERKSDGITHYHDPMTMAEITVTKDGTPLPEKLAWSGHDRELIARGFVEAGRADDSEPFEIPGQGMGLFACRRDAWLGFAKGCTGFGGEELNIHAKYRQAGHKAICLPWLKWNHRFGRAGGAPYPIPLAAKIRNYVIWAKELELPLDRIHTHFVASGQFPSAEWEKLIADPIAYHVALKTRKTVGTLPALDSLFARVAREARDLSEHAETIRTYASRVDSVTAFVKRADWEPMLAAGFPKSLEVYQSEESQLIVETHVAVDEQSVKDSRQLLTYSTHHKDAEIDPRKVEKIAPCDMLVIDKDNDAAYLNEVLSRHASAVSKIIMIRGTQTYGDKSETTPNASGLWHSMKEFVRTNKEWFVQAHYPNQYGLTILARDPIPRPTAEIIPWPIGYGPGTELKAILASVGINPGAACSCHSRMLQMDVWGIEGCEREFNTIVGWLNESAEQWGWTHAAKAKADDAETKDSSIKKMTLTEKMSIGWKSLMSGIVFHVNWLDPYPGLVREAINRAIENEPSACDGSDCKSKEACKKPNCKKKARAKA